MIWSIDQMAQIKSNINSQTRSKWPNLVYRSNGWQTSRLIQRWWRGVNGLTGWPSCWYGCADLGSESRQHTDLLLVKRRRLACLYKASFDFFLWFFLLFFLFFSFRKRDLSLLCDFWWRASPSIVVVAVDVHRLRWFFDDKKGTEW